MKKVFGIILLVLGFVINSFSMLGWGAVIASSRDVKGGGLGVSIVITMIGLILFVVGLFLVITKSEKHRKMEIELSNLKYNRDFAPSSKSNL